MSTTSYGSMTSNRKTSGKNARLKRMPGGAKPVSKLSVGSSKSIGKKKKSGSSLGRKKK